MGRAARLHGSLWITPAIRALRDAAAAAGLEVVWVTFPMCALGSEFQKHTTLLGIDPRAHRLRALSALRCHHAKHRSTAVGLDSDGRSNAARAGEYPVLAAAVFARLLFTDEEADWDVWLHSSHARQLQAYSDVQTQRNREGGRSEADSAYMPSQQRTATAAASAPPSPQPRSEMASSAGGDARLLA